MQGSMFIGLDVPAISVPVAQSERGGEARHWGTTPHCPDHVRKLVEKLGASGSRLYFCYEAGPCGYGLHRQLVELGHDPVSHPAGEAVQSPCDRLFSFLSSAA